MSASSRREGGARLPRVAALRDVVDVGFDNLWRRQIYHDIRHQLSTVVLLASVVSTSTDVGRVGRARVTQLILETKWLAELFRLYEQDPASVHQAEFGREAATRLDRVAADVLRPLRMSLTQQIVLEAAPATARVEMVGLWRALRNVVENAVVAAGLEGTVIVRVTCAGGSAVIEVHDDGPGFDPGNATPHSLGLTIVRHFMDASGGTLFIGRGPLGGCLVRLEFPNAACEP